MRILLGILLIGFVSVYISSCGGNDSSQEKISIQNKISELYKKLEYESNRVDHSDEWIELRKKSIELLSDSKKKADAYFKLSEELSNSAAKIGALRKEIDSLENLIDNK